jgi:hypothetical protein
MAKKLSRAEKIRRFLNANPNMALKDVAARFDTTYQIVYMTKKTMEQNAAKDYVNRTDALIKRRKKPEALPVPQDGEGYVYRWINTNALSEDAKDALASQLLDTVNPESVITMEEPQLDPVNHPYHYKVGGIETIDFIEAKELNYNMGNAVKYISRADHKSDKKQDIEKAVWYLNRELNKTKE